MKKKMWADKKWINLSINILLFLFGINIFHYGQFILPVICLLIFIDKKFHFYVEDFKEFLLLCLFAITFCAFSYSLGFYCVMGFCVPMAYYIGSNLKVKSFDSVKKVIYIISLGMAAHLLLNFGLELYWWYDDLAYLFNKPSHYDIWLYDKIKTTGTALNFIGIMSITPYLLCFEKEKKWKIVGLIFFVLSGIYSIALGKRSILLLFLFVVLFSFIYHYLQIQKKKLPIKLLVGSFVCVMLLVIVYFTNLFGFGDFMDGIRIIHKIKTEGFSSDRLNILIESFSYYPKYLFGGQKISGLTGNVIHDLWGDIYDYAGVVPYLLIVIYSIVSFIKVIKKISKQEKENKFLLINLFVCCVVMLFMEPIFTGASLYYLSIVIFFSAIETL